jgi:hypothetical protein
MKKDKKILMAGAAMVALSPMVAKSVLADSEPIQARALILQAVDISELASLDFGTFSVGATGGNIVLNPVAADVVQPGTVNQIGASSPNDAKINIKAAIGFPIVVAVATPTITLTANAGADTMKVSNFNIDTDAGGTNQVITLAAATETAMIGATLTVPGSAVAGSYTANFTVNANYQ